MADFPCVCICNRSKLLVQTHVLLVYVHSHGVSALFSVMLYYCNWRLTLSIHIYKYYVKHWFLLRNRMYNILYNHSRWPLVAHTCIVHFAHIYFVCTQFCAHACVCIIHVHAVTSCMYVCNYICTVRDIMNNLLTVIYRIWGAWQIPLAHPILVTCTFNSVIVTCTTNHIESTENCQWRVHACRWSEQVLCVDTCIV